MVTGTLIQEGIKMKSLYFGFRKSINTFTIIAVSIFLLEGCVFIPKKDNAEAMYIKASALTKLSTAVEVTVRYEAPDENLSDEELLKIATEDDPNLLDPFVGYVLKVNREFGHAVVLVCNADGTKGLLEDAGCSAKMDKHHWDEVKPCSFTISAAVVCSQ